MAKRQPVKTSRAAKRIERRSDTFASYYSNDTQVQTGPYDVRLTFGTVDAVRKDKNEIEVVQSAEVRMSPQQARVVLRILTKHLEDYERKFGSFPEIDAT